MEIVRLWALCHGGDMGNQILPEAGGMLDQPAWLMEAFAVVEGAMRRKKDG